jgi:hypothetical protein
MPPNGLLVRILQIPPAGTALPVEPVTLKRLHDNLLTYYNCTEWAPPLADDAHAPDAPAQGHDDDSARPLSLPPLNLLASLRVRQDEDNGEVAARPSLPPQRQVTKHTQPEHMHTCHPDGAPVLLEEDAATVTKLLAVRLVPKGLKIVFCLFVGYEENQTQ